MSRVRQSDAVSNQVQSYHQHSKASYGYTRKEIAREHRVLQECYKSISEGQTRAT